MGSAWVVDSNCFIHLGQKGEDEVLDDLNDMDMSSPGWLLRFKTLREQYQHHIDEEEEELFASAREQIGADADGRRRVGRHQAARRERVLAQTGKIDERRVAHAAGPAVAVVPLH